ncbi:DUF1127 domain-containing protein [Thioclava sp.]|uniref:DUF1127 domain-containing protein n=1 Tax=Thioclava sp. TaxID=1933450 RepID=UPI003AA8221C
MARALLNLLNLWARNRRTRRALSKLNHNQLEDIGVSRSAQRQELTKWFWD